MHPNLNHLIELQQVDMRLADVRARLAEFPAQLAGVEARVSAARQALEQARAALTQSLKDRKKYELDVEDWKGKLAKYKDQSAQVKTNEAYKALQHEIQTAETEIATAEDRLLERMVAGEELERSVKDAEKALKDTEAAATGERQQISAAQNATQAEFDALEKERKEVVQAVPEDLLDLYQRIARKHAGIALAEVRDETCTACRVRIRPHVFQELRRPESQELFHCESCTRILYALDQPVAAQAAKAAADSREQ